MKILVGISTRDRADILPKAIESALAQDWPEVEVAVFDDASADGTPALREKYPQVSWERSEEPKGYLHARNKMMRETGADLYCSLDDDAWFLERDELSIAAKLFEERPEAAAVAYDILSPDRPDPAERLPPQPTHMFIGCGHVLRLEAAREAGFYEPNPGSYGSEEKDLCLLLLDAGREIYKLPGVHVWHDKSMVGRDKWNQHRSNVCNDLVLAYRRCPMPWALGAIPGTALKRGLSACKHGEVGSYFAGLGLFARSLPGVIGTRRAISRRAFDTYRARARGLPSPERAPDA